MESSLVNFGSQYVSPDLKFRFIVENVRTSLLSSLKLDLVRLLAKSKF